MLEAPTVRQRRRWSLLRRRQATLRGEHLATEPACADAFEWPIDVPSRSASGIGRSHRHPTGDILDGRPPHETYTLNQGAGSRRKQSPDKILQLLCVDERGRGPLTTRQSSAGQSRHSRAQYPGYAPGPPRALHSVRTGPGSRRLRRRLSRVDPRSGSGLRGPGQMPHR